MNKNRIDWGIRLVMIGMVLVGCIGICGSPKLNLENPDIKAVFSIVMGIICWIIGLILAHQVWVSDIERRLSELEKNAAEDLEEGTENE